MTAEVVRRRRRAVVAVACAAAAVPALSPSPSSAEQVDGPMALYLVTLTGPGTAGLGTDAGAAARMTALQDELLATVGAPDPVYRWTTALNGFAVELDADQVADLTSHREVAAVEENAVLPLARSTRSTAVTVGGAPAPGGAGGEGTVIGFVDTGIDPRNPAFSQVTPLGAPVRGFRGRCADAPDEDGWSAEECTAKVVAAEYFVAGFGEERLRTTASLSPLDVDGHGTQMASIAAGTTDVPVRVDGQALGRFSGVASRARVAAYKACWSAPDPRDDGCATADLVAAIDRATADGVDVLNVSVGGPPTIDTVERALLGATEAGIVVTAAAGNGGDTSYAAHPSPWVVTVGAATGAERSGSVVAVDGPRVAGAMAATSATRRARLVVGATAAAAGRSRADARVCAPGSLDAREVADAVVVCARGEVARVDKSRAVALADGRGMVLVNLRPGSVDADLHAVPTVHLGADEGRELVRWARAEDRPRVRLVPAGLAPRPATVARFSGSGDPTTGVVKPDVVARGTGVVAAVPGGWGLATGTSAATARVSGTAALLLARGGSPEEVRAALVATARPITGPTGPRGGAGVVTDGGLPPMAMLIGPSAYRAWLDGERHDLPLPQAVLDDRQRVLRRTLTNTTGRRLSVSVRGVGLLGGITATPSVVSMGPGERVRFTVRMGPAPAGRDAGAVVWRTDAGAVVRLPVVRTR